MRTSTKIGYRLGLLFMGIGLIIFFWPGAEELHRRGPMIPGHETLSCQSCHLSAPGTTRQQIQANVRYRLGLRTTAAAFQHLPVTNETCLACHIRPRDNHPVHRFTEPRFAEARAAIQPQFCSACHGEHQGVRVTSEATFCVHCHADLTLKHDPLVDTSHAALIAAEQWDSCLTCHDFHGNHAMTPKVRQSEQLPITAVLAYFKDAPSPYSAQKFYQATEERPNE